MKRQIRRGVFETNSSSVHSLTMCSDEEYKKWERGEILFNKHREKFGTKEEFIEELKKKPWTSKVNWDDEDEVRDVFFEEGIQTCDEFFDNGDFETFAQCHTTPNGEVIVAFGYYGCAG